MPVVLVPCRNCICLLTLARRFSQSPCAPAGRRPFFRKNQHPFAPENRSDRNGPRQTFLPINLGQGCSEGLGCPINNKADSGQDQAPPKENAMACVGVNLGALTVKVVAVRGDDREARVAAHQGRPVEVLKKLLAGSRVCRRGLLRRVRASGTHLRGGGHPAGAARVGRTILTRWFPWAESPSWFTCWRTEGSPMSCRTTNAPPAAASSSCSRLAGWGSASRKRSGARSRARWCRWPRAARFTANRTSRTSSTGRKPRRRTFCTRCTTAWPARWLRCWRRRSASCSGCC